MVDRSTQRNGRGGKAGSSTKPASRAQTHAAGLLTTEDALSAAFHALSDPSRRHILAILREAGELKIGDIAAVFEMSLNGVSKHVKVLEAAGLVERRIVGREHWLRVNGGALVEPLQFLESHHTFWTARLDALESHMKSRRKRKKSAVKPPKKTSRQTAKRPNEKQPRQ